jgi:hypothetical protein
LRTPQAGGLWLVVFINWMGVPERLPVGGRVRFVDFIRFASNGVYLLCSGQYSKILDCILVKVDNKFKVFGSIFLL